MKTFGEFIREKRLERSINLRKLAEMLDIAPAYMSDIENNKRNPPSNEKMEKLIEI
ncbi:MAG: helix-turn-helix transcriptional regulator, partial [Clostridia bacterium]|nr:helix-turn-helix transcriptional regulator [Clostridia bacterium]